MEQLTQSQKISLGTKEIAKRIRQEIKNKYPQCKFSITMQSYSGGSSISIALMSAPFDVFKDPSTITEDTIHRYFDGRTLEDIRDSNTRKYVQLNYYQLLDDYKDDTWCNGAFLTKEAHQILQDVVKITNQYNYDNSDSTIDYFDTNFYLHMSIGHWDKPFQVSQ